MKKYLGVLIGAVVTVLAAGGASASNVEINYTTVGSLDYLWTGVPSRGCAADGLCGVTGSIQVNPNASSDSGGTPPSADVNDDSAVVRVEYPGIAGAAERVCANPMPYDVQFALARGDGFRTGDPEPNDPVSAGECAGPTAAELEKVRLPVRREANGNYNLSGKVSFGAGPFDVTVVSKLRVRVSRQSQNGAGEFNGSPPSKPSTGRVPKPRRVLVEEANAYYRVSRVTGAVVDQFTGLPAPRCDPLADCGASGSVSMTIQPISRLFEVGGYRIVRHRVSSTRALSDLRAGRLLLADDSYVLDPSSTLHESVSAAGVASCADTILRPSASFGSTQTRAEDRLYLDPVDGDEIEPQLDPLRTWCPGPSTVTIVDSGAVAAGVIPASKIGTSQIRLVLSSSGSFAGAGYRGTRAGAIAVTLVRDKLSAGTVSQRAYGNYVP